jgi:hypothetical protein
VPPGTAGTVTVVVRNMGRDAAPNVSVASDPFVFAGPVEYLDVVLDAIPATTCTVSGESFGDLHDALLQFGTVASGTAASCTIGFSVAPLATGTRNMAFRPVDRAYGIHDDRPDNDTGWLGFQFDGAAVPGLDRNGVALTTLLLACLALGTLRQVARRH